MFLFKISLCSWLAPRFKRKEGGSQENMKGEKKWLNDHNSTIKKTFFFYINKFYLIKRFLLWCFKPSILIEKVGLDNVFFKSDWFFIFLRLLMNLLISVRFFYIYFRVKKKLTMSFLGKKYNFLKKLWASHVVRLEISLIGSRTPDLILYGLGQNI
jgi:hypothetical protein